MTKHEFPPFNMTIESGRLVPATPYDAERLASFTRGTKVKVRFTEEKDRILVRKWFAIIGLVIKQCETPWKNKDEAHEAIKLALGIVNLSKTVGGDFMAYPKSLTDLEEPEMQEALQQMTELLSRMTGVDVETLNRETAHIQPEPDEPHDAETGELLDTEASAATPPDATDDGADRTAPQEPAGELPHSAPAGSSSEPTELSSDERRKLITCYAQFLAISDEDELDVEAQARVLMGSKDKWKTEVPARLHGHLKSLYVSALGVIKGHDKRKAAREYAAFLECTAEELIGESA